MTVEQLGFAEVTQLRGYYQSEGNVSMQSPVGLLQCLFLCLRLKKCILAFYNENSNTCVLHSKTFHYKLPYIYEDGWQAYITKDLNSRCPEELVHYRELDLCYKIYNGTINNMLNIGVHVEQVCSAVGAELIRIDSEEKQQYIEYVMYSTGVDNNWVCIQGKNYLVRETFTFDDTTPMTYFKWGTDQPTGSSLPRIIAMNVTYLTPALTWYDLSFPFSDTCDFVCEIVR